MFDEYAYAKYKVRSLRKQNGFPSITARRKRVQLYNASARHDIRHDSGAAVTVKPERVYSALSWTTLRLF